MSAGGVGKDWEAGDVLKLWIQFWQFCSLSLTIGTQVQNFKVLNIDKHAMHLVKSVL